MKAKGARRPRGGSVGMGKRVPVHVIIIAPVGRVGVAKRPPRGRGKR